MKASETTTTFADLKAGEQFMFVRSTPHPLGWPDGPWTKTGSESVSHLHNGVEGDIESVDALVQVLWTAERVRAELPTVTVKATTARNVETGRVQGRCGDFATVVWGDDRRAEWAWETVARCLNEGRPLLY